MWPTAEGYTSATPTSRHVPYDSRGEELVVRVWEALELPGSAMDYHFILQNAVDRLWSTRNADPRALEMLEVFALLDLELMEAAPQAVSFDGTEPMAFVRPRGADPGGQAPAARRARSYEGADRLWVSGPSMAWSSVSLGYRARRSAVILRPRSTGRVWSFTAACTIRSSMPGWWGGPRRA